MSATDPGRFDLGEAVAILERTPASLAALLAGLPERLLGAREGPGSWSPREVLVHLIHGERVNWMPRARYILAGDGRPFEPFDRTAGFAENEATEIEALLATFAELRGENLAALAALHLTAADLARTGQHPALGEVTLAQLLATWAVHDLDHVGQVARTVAKAYAGAVGPWSAFLSILRDREPVAA